MPRSLESRSKFLVRGRRKKKSLPWLRHKFLQLQLWTAAYMLDTWEAAVVFLSLPLLVIGLIYVFTGNFVLSGVVN